MAKRSKTSRYGADQGNISSDAHGARDKAHPASDDALADATFIKEALARYDRGVARDRENIDEAYEDLAFRAGEQWEEDAKKDRADRPCLTVNRIPQFVRQITGDIRQMRPAVKVTPVDDAADPETARVLSGLIRHIENRSYARKIYAGVADSQVTCGIGHWKVVTEYAGESTFDQELRIIGIEDGVSVVWDPDALLPTREDAAWCFVPVDMSTASFEERFPDAQVESLRSPENARPEWYGEDHVRVAEYWVKKPCKRRLALLPDGSVDDVSDEDEARIAQLEEAGVRVEERDGHTVCRYLITASEILEGPIEWPGRLIPIVPVIGEEVKIGRRIVRHGIVRFARDPQRMYNYFRSAQTEVVALQPKAPFLATEAMVKNNIDQWESANTKNWPVLYYEPDPKAAGARPERVAPPISSQGISEGTAQASEDLKSVTGIYDASLGARSNETSGRAIMARQREGDVGSFVYLDNFSLAIQHTGKILIDLIPHIYDTERTIRIVGEDGRMERMEINRPVMIDGLARVMNDVTSGAYDVSLDIGPSYTTRREEAKDGMREFIQSSPGMAPLLGDLYAKAQDWPLADEVARRLHAMLPEPIRNLDGGDETRGPGQPPGPPGAPTPPNPAQLAQAQQMQAQQHKQQIEMQAGMAKAQAEIAEAQARAALAEANAKTAQVKLRQEELRLQEMQMRLAQAAGAFPQA